MRHYGLLQILTAVLLILSGQSCDKKVNDENPFFLFMSYDAVHEFISNPDEYNNMYDTGYPDKDQYYANITYLDHQIGRLIDFLNSKGLRENTVIIFSSDNGPEIWRTNPNSGRSFGTSYPLHGQKRQLYEGGIRVLGLISWKDKIMPQVSHFPNIHYNLLPTICSIAKINIAPYKIDGISLDQYLLNSVPVHRKRPLYWQFEKRRRSWDLEGEGYNQRFVGNKPRLRGMPPQVVIREDDYILYGYSEKLYIKPNLYKMYNIKKDPLMTKDLSSLEPSLFNKLILELEEIYQDVNRDRMDRAREIRMKINQNIKNDEKTKK
tara:strand:- start:13290 stop:14252 length:963 start_codon:yes stop_codon:yes gene_type:complete